MLFHLHLYSIFPFCIFYMHIYTQRHIYTMHTQCHTGAAVNLAPTPLQYQSSLSTWPWMWTVKHWWHHLAKVFVPLCVQVCALARVIVEMYKYWKKMFYCTLSEYFVSLMQRATVENVCIAFSFVAMLTVCLPLGQLTLRKAILISVIFTWWKKWINTKYLLVFEV